MRTLARTSAALLAAAAPVVGLLCGPAATAGPVVSPEAIATSPVSVTFGYTGSAHTFTVPTGVHSVNLVADGGAGGDGGGNDQCPYGHGGPASRITGSLDVSPGDTLTFFVASGGHLSGAGGASGPTGQAAGGHGGGDGGIGSGNGGGGGGATTLSYNGRLVLTAAGGGGGGGRGISALTCGGDGGAAGSPAQNGYNGTASTPGRYGTGGMAWSPGPYGAPAPDGTTGPGASGAGGGGGGGDGAPNGGGGHADQDNIAAGGGGGGAGGTSAAQAPLTDIGFATQGSHGSAGSVTISYGHPTNVSVPPATAQGDQLVLHAIVDGVDGGGIDGGGAVGFLSDANGVVGLGGTPITGCTALPLTQVSTGLFEVTCETRIAGVGNKVTAVYSGDEVYGSSFGSGLYTINRLATTTTASTGAPSVAPGATVTIDTRVGGGDGLGSVSLSDLAAAGSPTVGSCAALSGSAPATAACTATLAAGVHQLVVSYSGDRAYLPSKSAPVTVVAATAPTIAGTPGRPQVGTPFSFAYTVGGQPAPTVAVTTGSLPPGLALSTDGVLSGTPTGAGSYPVTLTATNPASGATATLDSTITVVRNSVSVSASTLRFGSLAVGASASRRVTVTNTGTADWVYEGAAVSTPELAVTGGTCLDGNGAAVGKSCTAVVSFTPSAAGPRSGTVTLRGNPSVTIDVTATGVVAVRTASVTPRSATVRAAVGRSATRTVRVRNTGNVPWQITSRIVSGDRWLTVSGGTCTPGRTLAPGRTCSVTLRYRPAAPEARTARLRIIDGAGTQRVRMHLVATARCRRLVVSTRAVYFGRHHVGMTSAVGDTLSGRGA